MPFHTLRLRKQAKAIPGEAAMAYRLVADLAVIIHGGFILFVLLGGFLVFRWRGWVWLYLPAFLWAGFIGEAMRTDAFDISCRVGYGVATFLPERPP
jgi:hypothetical protein